MSIALSLAGYFLLVSTAAALLMLPAWRRAIAEWVQQQWNGSRRAMQRTGTATGRGLSSVHRAATALARNLAQWRPRQWLAAAALLAGLAVPSLLALSLGADPLLEGYDEAAGRHADPHVLALLRGEQLVPPAPLPPDVFATREVQAERPLLFAASREWAALDADFRQRLLLVFKIMRERHGYDMVLLEGYRSPERQERLFGSGAGVTRAAAFQSYHQFGLAADCGFYRDGRLVINEKDAWAARGYALYGEVAESAGLTWGGRWTSIVDLGHVELRPPRGLPKAPARPS